MRSRWSLPAVALAVTLCLISAVDWPARVPVTPPYVLATVSANATLAFGFALLFEVAQSLRTRLVRFSRVWSIGLLVAMLSFSWCVGSELVHAVQRLAAIGYVHVLALSLAAGCALMLFGLRSSGFGLGGSTGQRITLLSNVVVAALLLWAQHRYRIPLREAKFASVSAAFLLLTGVACLRLIERFRQVETNRRGLATLACAFSLSVAGFALSSDQSLRQLYFAGLFPGRILFAVHLPELLLHRAALVERRARFLDAATAARAQPSSARLDLARDESRAEIVVFLLVDALRADAFHRYVNDPQSKLHAASRESCIASTLYAPASNTVATLTKLLWQSNAAGQTWFDLTKSSGVNLSFVVDEQIAALMNRSLPSTLDAQFDQVVRVPRQPDGDVAPLCAAVLPLLEMPGPRVIWAHFLEVHEWARSGPRASIQLYDDRVAQVGVQVAELLDVISRSKRKVSVILTSDHGEGLDHYSTRHHGEYVYEPLVRVPLMLWTHGFGCPENVAAFHANATSATLLRRLTLDQLGIPSLAQEPTLQELAGRPVVIQASMQDAIIRWPNKLIVSPWFTQLYDLAADPNELHDLSSISQTLVHDLRGLLDDETRTL